MRTRGYRDDTRYGRRAVLGLALATLAVGPARPEDDAAKAPPQPNDVAVPDLHFSVDTKAAFFGEIQAIEVNTGKRVWRDLYSSSMMWGSLLTTAGGLVFGGGTNDREFRAFDASTGEQLWHFRTNSGVIAPPSTYTVNGVQYVAVASGWGVDAAFQEGLMSELVGWQKDVPQGGVVWVFAVAK